MILAPARHDGKWRLLAITASALLHLWSLIWLADRNLITASTAIPRAPQTAVRLNFTPPAPPTPPKVEETVEPQPKPEPVVEPTPAPKPKPKPKPKTRPVSKPKPRPEPAPPAKPAKIQPPATAPKPAPVPDPSYRQAEAQREREAYLSRLLVLIEKNKFYPRPARKRGIEGTVTVSFVLMGSGIPHDLKVEGGHRLLCKAAQAAVKKAAPFPEPPADLALPLPVTYRMAFQLD